MSNSNSNATAPSAQYVPDEPTIADAYVYLLARTLVIRQEHMDLQAEGGRTTRSSTTR